jgi:hypothetical protein
MTRISRSAYPIARPSGELPVKFARQFAGIADDRDAQGRVIPEPPGT